MESTKVVLLMAAMVLVATVALPRLAYAGGRSVPINYGSLFTGKKAPPGAKAKLKRAAQLAAKGKHCASVGSGFYIPPSEQLASHKGQPYMVTCKANDSRGYYNVYFSDADLKASRKKDRVKPVSRKFALQKCANALRQKFPTARLNGLESAYDASKSTSNVLQEIGLTVENQFGVRVHRVGKCIITPDGHIGSKDVWLIKG